MSPAPPDEPDGEAAFDAFVTQRSRALLRTAWLLTGDWGLAQDLVQASLLRTWERWDRVLRQDAPENYVRQVMLTVHATWWRRRWRGETPTPTLPEPDHGGDGDEADRAEAREVLRLALATLPRRQRAVVVLRFFEDLTEPAAAALLGCSVGTVKSQQSKALARLRAHPGVLALVGTEVTP